MCQLRVSQFKGSDEVAVSCARTPHIGLLHVTAMVSMEHEMGDATELPPVNVEPQTQTPYH